VLTNKRYCSARQGERTTRFSNQLYGNDTAIDMGVYFTCVYEPNCLFAYSLPIQCSRGMHKTVRKRPRNYSENARVSHPRNVSFRVNLFTTEHTVRVNACFDNFVKYLQVPEDVPFDMTCTEQRLGASVASCFCLLSANDESPSAGVFAQLSRARATRRLSNYRN